MTTAARLLSIVHGRIAGTQGDQPLIEWSRRARRKVFGFNRSSKIQTAYAICSSHHWIAHRCAASKAAASEE